MSYTQICFSLPLIKISYLQFFWMLLFGQVRKLELLISILVFVMAGCFFGEMSYVKPPASGVLKGMFVPKLSGQGATGDAIALLGALVMPYSSLTCYFSVYLFILIFSPKKSLKCDTPFNLITFLSFFKVLIHY